MAKQVTRWQAKDGTIWDDETTALNHELALESDALIAEVRQAADVKAAYDSHFASVDAITTRLKELASGK
jgi:hypothetical protein